MNERYACVLAEGQHLPALLEIAREFSPLIAACPGGVYLDIAGERDEAGLLETLLYRASFPARAGAAGTRTAALVAARLAEREPIVAPPGGEAAFLRRLPFTVLAPSDELAEVLTRWGLHTLGALAALPEGEITRRLGEEGRRLHLAARGVDERPMVPLAPPVDFLEEAHFDWTVFELEPFLNLAQPALERLSGRLQHAGVAARRLDLELQLEDGSARELRLVLAAPTADVKTWRVLLGLELEKRPPADGMIGLSVLAHPERALTKQLQLFEPPAQSPALLATTLARLAALLGADRVGSPKPVDAHMPEHFDLAPYEADCGTTPPAKALPAPAAAALRVLRPRVELDVALDGEAPARLASRFNGPLIRGWVRAASGPWKVEERWWAPKFEQRRYWDVELSDGGLYRIYRVEPGGLWFADGVYD